MTVTVKHAKTNAISDWTQAQLDEQIALGNFAPGTTLAQIVLPSDWNNDHTLTGVGTMAEQNANSVAITGGSINGTTIGSTTASTGKFTSVTTPSVTASSTDLTLSAISTGGVFFNTANGTGFRVRDTGSATSNYWQALSNGSAAIFRSSDSIANAQLQTGGTGAVQLGTASGVTQLQVSHTASAVNYVQVTGGNTGTYPAILGTGSDGTVGLQLAGKGGTIDFRNNGIGTATQFSVAFTASSVNYLNATGSGVSGNAPRLYALGTDTNISMAFQPKGTGAIDLAAGSSGVNISNGGTVTAITRTNAGSGYTSFPTPVISAPTTAGGGQAVATVGSMLAGNPTTIQSGGTGYTVNDTLTIVGGTPTASSATYTVTAVSGGVVTAVTALNFAQYTALPTNPVSTTGGTGTGCTLNVTYGLGTSPSFNISNAGSGYIEQPTVTFSGGGGSGASAYATVGSATVFKSLANMGVFTAGGQQFGILDSAATSTAYWQAIGGAGTADLRTNSGSTTGAYISNGAASAINFRTNINASPATQAVISHTASAVNYVQVTGSATANDTKISAQGSDANIGMAYSSKGGYFHRFWTNNFANQQFAVFHTNNSANYGTVKGGIAGASPVFGVEGSDTNIDLALTPKGTGRIKFGTYTATISAITGYIEILDSGGTVRRLAVVA